MTIKTMRNTVATLAAAALFSAPATFAAQGSTDVEISFPPLIILYYFDDVDITVDADDLEQVILNGNAGLSSCVQGTGAASELECASSASPKSLSAGSVSGTTISYSAAIEGDTPTSAAVDGTVSFTLENSWAVRALATSLTASVAASGSGDFLNETIAPVAPTPSLTLTDGQNIGDLSFDVDLASLTGLTASDTLTITVVAP
jgi:hypothetical protein